MISTYTHRKQTQTAEPKATNYMQCQITTDNDEQFKYEAESIIAFVHVKTNLSTAIMILSSFLLVQFDNSPKV